MTTVETCGGEEITVGAHGADALRVVVTDPAFGRIATVRLDHEQASQLAIAVGRLLVDAAGGVPAAPED